MSILPDKYDSYLRFFKLILKYWNSDIFSDSALEDELEEGESKEWDHKPEELVEDLKNMGPTYIKLGQLLSTRPDMLPPPYLEALASLQDEVASVDYKEVEQIFQSEIGERISKAFKSFDKEPLASASIGQVHIGVLHSGEKVAVKIQRPGIRKKFLEDLETLMTLSKKAEDFSEQSKKMSLHDIVEELRHILLQELDYTKEADNLRILKKNLQKFKHLYVPSVVDSYSSEKVLTMEYIKGQKATTLSPFQLADIPKEELADDFVKGYLKQIIVDGFAHADPHPGNIHIMENGKLALMDLGMVARFSNRLREMILKLMIGIGDNDGEQVTQVLLNMSDHDEHESDIDRFRKHVNRLIQDNQDKKAEDLQTGQLIMKMNKSAVQHGIKLPVELISLGKILLNMDQIIAVLAPDYKLQETVRRYIQRLMRDQMFQEIKSGNILQNLLESKEFMENLPYRLNRITDDLTNHKFKIKMDVFDERRFILAFQKVANRITAGLVVAALIMGAAIVMHIPTSWNIMGYPGFAMLLFVCAAFIGFYLVYQILFKDEDNSK